MTGGSAEAPRCPGVVGPHSWAAEVVADEALARRPLRQFRELDLRSLRLLATGWDRTVWLVNEAGAFGFPRREIVVPGIERELVWLPHLAPLLPLPIPEPRFVGEPTGEFPWPFFGAVFVPGVEAWKAPLNDTARLAVALELACSSEPAATTRAGTCSACPAPSSRPFVAPTLPAGSESPPVELVRFVRDEMANLAWAIEAVVEGQDGRGTHGPPRPRAHPGPCRQAPPPATLLAPTGPTEACRSA